MRVPSPTTGTTNLPQQSEKYLQAAIPDLSGLTRGLSSMAAGLSEWDDKRKKEADQLKRFKATEGFVEFNSNAQLKLDELKQSALPEDLNFSDRAITSYSNYEDEFISTLPPDLQDEFRMRAAQTRTTVAEDATKFQQKNLQTYQKNSMDKIRDKANTAIAADPGTLEGWKSTLDEAIDNSAYSDVEKYYMKQENARLLESRGYRTTVKEQMLSKPGASGRRLPMVLGTQPGRQAVDTSGLQADVQSKWELVQGELGRTIPVVSAFRDEKRNKAAGGADHSQHLHGNALDIDVRGMPIADRRKLIQTASAIGFTGVGVYDNSIHLDTGTRRAWGSTHKSGSVPEWAADVIAQHKTGTVAAAYVPKTGDELWARLIHTESGGNQAAVSPKGALGRAQVMPETGPEAARLAGLPWDLSKLQNDPAYNEALGKAYLNAQMETFGGDTAKALAAYNAGPGRVRQAVAKYGDNWQKGLPDETVDYVGKILGGGSVDEDPRFANVPYEDRLAIRADVQGEVKSYFAAQNKQQTEARAAQMNDLFNRLNSGEAGKADLDRMIEDGLVPDYDDRKKAQGILDERDKNGKALRSGQARLASGAPFDLSDADQKKELNALFGDEGVKKLQSKDEKYIGDVLAPLFTKTAALPSDAVGMLGAMANSSNPADMLYAFQALSILENTNPEAYGAQIKPGLRQRADAWERLNETLPQKDLIEMLREAPTQMQRDTKEYYRKEGEKLFSSPVDPVKFALQFDDLGASPSAPTLQVAESEWNTLFLENYSRYGGNREAAVTLTNKQFSRVWKKSNMDGAEVLMKHPPEIYTPLVAGSHDWLQQQVRGELGLTDAEHYVLVTDKRTESEIAQAQEAGTKPDPTWLIMVQREDGLWDMARNADGAPQRQQFKPTMYDAKANELDLRVKAKELELKNVMELMTPYGTSLSGPPQEIQDRANKINAELEALKLTRSNAQADAKNAYSTPAALEVVKLKKQYNAYQDELYNDYLGPLEEWPKAEEFAKVIDALHAAEEQAAKELAQKRAPIEGQK